MRLTIEVTILAVLLVVASTRLTDIINVLSEDPTHNCELEYVTVQVGLDNYKSKNHLIEVPAATTTDMT
jgi:hypothetical protein